METQSGARTPLVDPFGRELEAWLRDAPATRTPYLADLVVPPVTGPVQRPDAVVEPAAHAAAPAIATEAATVSADAPAPEAASVDDTAFRRPRDRARHVAACAPSFPEPPERLALRIEDLAVEVSATSGRTTIERIVILEDEVRRRDEDLARLAAWEATVALVDDPEAEAAREFARTVFADLLADAALEADRRDRAAARRAATAPVAVVLRTPERRSTAAVPHSTPPLTVSARSAASRTTAPALVPAAETVDAIDGAAPTATDGSDRTTAPEPTSAGRALPVRPVLGLQAVTPVSANTRPTPLVQPATGPTVIDRAAFAAALTAHQGATASTPVVLPEAVTLPAPAAVVTEATADETTEPAGWWSRFVARVLRALGRR